MLATNNVVQNLCKLPRHRGLRSMNLARFVAHIFRIQIATRHWRHAWDCDAVLTVVRVLTHRLSTSSSKVCRPAHVHETS